MSLQRPFIMSVLIAVSFLLMIMATSVHAGDESPDLNSLSDDDLKAVTVNFERKACFGTCPAYTVTIHGDGRVEYVGKSDVKEQGSRQGRVDKAAVKALMSQFAAAKFWSLSDYAGEKCCSVCTDMATAVTELTVKGVSHRVLHYYGCSCAPKALFELEFAIDKSIKVEQWTGDVSKAGPYGTTCFNPQK